MGLFNTAAPPRPRQSVEGDVPIAVELRRADVVGMDVTRRSDVGNGLDCHAIVVKLEGSHPDRQLLMRLQSSEALVGLDHAGRGRSQGHAGILPAFDVARDAANGAHHVLGDLGRGERSSQLRWHLQPEDSQDFLGALEDGGRYAGPLLVESTRQIADQFFSLVGIELPGLAEHATCGRMMLFGQAFRDVARLVDLAALDRGGRTEGAADPFDNAFAPSTMNSLGTVGRARARPRCPAWPEPLRRSRSLLPPARADACCLPSTPIASTSTRS